MILTIDPAGLTRAQRAGRRCVVPNCARHLPVECRYRVGQFPDGQPAYACEDCAPAVQPPPAHLSAELERVAL